MITSGFKYTFTYLSCQYRNLGEAHFEQQINTGHAQHLEGVTHTMANPSMFVTQTPQITKSGAVFLLLGLQTS